MTDLSHIVLNKPMYLNYDYAFDEFSKLVLKMEGITKPEDIVRDYMLKYISEYKEYFKLCSSKFHVPSFWKVDELGTRIRYWCQNCHETMFDIIFSNISPVKQHFLMVKHVQKDHVTCRYVSYSSTTTSSNYRIGLTTTSASTVWYKP